MALYPATLGVILAGGRALRMGGGDKTLLKLQAQTLLSHVEKRLRPQCESIILSANGDPSRFAETGLPVIPDSVENHPGPLAGILAALEWAAQNKPSIEWVVSVPGDTPFIPIDLVARLHEARSTARCPLACAASGVHKHYTTALWPVARRDDLRHALTTREVRRVEDWAKNQGLAIASWPSEPLDPFFNINTPDELNAASVMLSGAAPLVKSAAQDNDGPQERCDG